MRTAFRRVIIIALGALVVGALIRASQRSRSLLRKLATGSVPPAGPQAWPEGGALRAARGIIRTEGAAATYMQETPTGEASEAGARGASTGPIITDEAIFRFYNAADQQAFIRMARKLGIEVIGELRIGFAVRVRFADEDALGRLLAEAPMPLDRSPNYRLPPPVDPIDETRGVGGPYVAFGDRLLEWFGVAGANADWGRGVTIAVLDTAVGHHPNLNEQRVLRVNNYGVDPKGLHAAHGTAVATLIAGDGAGAAGIAPAARIISIPVMSGEGVGDAFTLAQGIVDAVAMGADIINLSLGSAGDSLVLRDAVAHALANNVAVVAATGNDASDVVASPARYSGVIAVGAVDADGEHVFFSNRGEEVDVAAPGYGVAAAGPGESVGLFSGTSAATPIVSGAIAAVMSENPGLTAIEAAARVVATADDAGAPAVDPEYGGGILDVSRAQQQGTPGIYDMATAPPYVGNDSAEDVERTLYVYAQNRGTEAIPLVRMTVVVDGETETLEFRDVQPGATVSREYVVDRAGMNEPFESVIRQQVEIPGLNDATPRDNERDSLVTVLPPDA